MQLLEDLVGSFPAQLAGPRRFGQELEIPVVNAPGTRDAYDQYDVQALLLQIFEEDGGTVWKPEIEPGTHRLLGLTNADGYGLTTDAGKGHLELIAPPHADVNCVEHADRPFLRGVYERFERNGGWLLASGTQPAVDPTRPEWSKKERYAALIHAFGADVLRIGVAMDWQSTIDLAQDEAAPAVNVFNCLGGVIVSLFANSPVLNGRPTSSMATREGFYQHFARGRSGVFPKQIGSIEEYYRFMTGQQLRIAQDAQGGYYALAQAVPFRKALRTFGMCQRALWKLHATAIWWGARLRTPFDSSVKHAAIEVRQPCAQPWEDLETVEALCLGMIEQVHALDQLVRQYPVETWFEFNRSAISRGVRAQFRDESAKPLQQEVLRLAEAGLKGRGLGEERFLQPLWQRVEDQFGPANRQLEILERHGLPGLVKHLHRWQVA